MEWREAMYKRPGDLLPRRHTDKSNDFLEWTRLPECFRTTVRKPAKDGVQILHVFRHGYIGGMGDLVGVEVNGREEDGAPEESSWVAPNCGKRSWTLARKIIAIRFDRRWKKTCTFPIEVEVEDIDVVEVHTLGHNAFEAFDDLAGHYTERPGHIALPCGMTNLSKNRVQRAQGVDGGGVLADGHLVEPRRKIEQGLPSYCGQIYRRRRDRQPAEGVSAS